MGLMMDVKNIITPISGYRITVPYPKRHALQYFNVNYVYMSSILNYDGQNLEYGNRNH